VPLSIVVMVHAAATRKMAMRPGIRMAAWFDHKVVDGAAIVHDVIVEFDGPELRLGSSIRAMLMPLHPELWPELRAGTRFDFWEPGSEGSWAEVLESALDDLTG
jgi:hypothetical protein